MSAWLVMSALGLYAVDPVSANYVVGSPLFRQVDIDLGNGRMLTLLANDNSERNVFVRGLRWNGQPLSRAWLRHAELAAGGTLEFDMGPEPNLAFGTQPQDLPPSFA